MCKLGGDLQLWGSFFLLPSQRTDASFSRDDGSVITRSVVFVQKRMSLAWILMTNFSPPPPPPLKNCFCVPVMMKCHGSTPPLACDQIPSLTSRAAVLFGIRRSAEQTLSLQPAREPSHLPCFVSFPLSAFIYNSPDTPPPPILPPAFISLLISSFCFPAPLMEKIARSWRRCQSSGLSPALSD